MKRAKFFLQFVLLSLFLTQACSSESTPSPQFNFTTTAPTSTDHNGVFSYTFRATSDNNSTITYEITAPDWIAYDEASLTLSGTPGWELLNQSFTISIVASNDEKSIRQTQSVMVSLGEIICDTDFGDPAGSQYILPFQAGESYKMSNPHCNQNPNAGHVLWFALDFDMPIGTPLIASRAGTVIAVREDQADATRVCGEENYVFILHDDGTVASYVHLTTDGAEVEVNDQVEQGQLIGYSGDSGCSIGPHTHFVVYKQRGPYDRQYSLPINFNNSEGALTTNNAFIVNEFYTAK